MLFVLFKCACFLKVAIFAASYIPSEEGDQTNYIHKVRRISGTVSHYGLEYLHANLGLHQNTSSDRSQKKQVTSLLRSQEFVSSLRSRAMGDSFPTVASDQRDWLPITKRLEDFFDIVIVLSSDTPEENWLAFLAEWRVVLEPMHLIVIQTGVPIKQVAFPSWATDYEVYNRNSIQKAATTRYWIFDLDKGSKSARSVGCLVADRDFIFFLDTDTLPAKDEQGKIINPLEEHLINLLTPSNPYYFMPQSPYRPGSDFPRGYPYSLKKGLYTAMSVGPVLNMGNYDALTRLLKPHERETRRPDSSMTLPYGVLFSLHTANLAINRHVVGALFYCGSGLLKKLGYDIGDKNADILTGWIIKVVTDHLRVGIVYGGNGCVMNNETIDSADEVAQDLVWVKDSESVVRYFTKLGLYSHDNLKSAKRFGLVVATAQEVARGLTTYLAEKVNPVYRDLGKGIEEFAILHHDAKGYYARVVFVASQSSIAPPPVSVSPHQCAAFTIFHHEPVFLPLWLRYYSKHFPESLFVAQHFFNVSIKSSPAHLKSLQPDFSLVSPGVKVGHFKLFGNSEGYPINFLIDSGQLIQERLFRAGFKCVLYTDCDEFIAPDPAKYPGGLKEYLTKFSEDTKKLHFRAQGHIVGHVSESMTKAPPLEQPINWSAPILSQRSYWLRKQFYDKPLLSKIPVRWKVGFHTSFMPFISHDLDLHLIHLNDADAATCLAKESKKFKVLSSQGKQQKFDGGFSGHIWSYPEQLRKGTVCKNARAIFDEVNGAVFDFTRQTKFEKMDPKWKNVEI